MKHSIETMAEIATIRTILEFPNIQELIGNEEKWKPLAQAISERRRNIYQQLVMLEATTKFGDYKLDKK